MSEHRLHDWISHVLLMQADGDTHAEIAERINRISPRLNVRAEEITELIDSIEHGRESDDG